MYLFYFNIYIPRSAIFIAVSICPYGRCFYFFSMYTILTVFYGLKVNIGEKWIFYDKFRLVYSSPKYEYA